MRILAAHFRKICVSVLAVDELYRRSRAEAYGIGRDRFAEMLEAVCERCLPGAGAGERRSFMETLRVEDLTLAWGCALGNSAAWERFVECYREKLYAISMGLTHDAVSARELADSLYADLFASRLSTANPGASRFETYSGRGSLEGWLRAVLAREHTNRFRTRRLLVSYEEEVKSGHRFGASPTLETPVDSRLERALDQALCGLSVQDRFLLASHYLDGRTLAIVANAIGVHESTVSRRLSRLLKRLRSDIGRRLGKLGCDSRCVQEMLDGGAERIELDLRRRLEAYDPERV